MYYLLEDEVEASERFQKTILRANVRIEPNALLTTFGLPLPTLVTQNSRVVYVFVRDEEIFTLFDYCLAYDPTKKKYRKARVPFHIGSLPGRDCSLFANWLTRELGLTSQFVAFNYATILK